MMLGGCFFLYPKSFAGLSRFFGTVSVVVGSMIEFLVYTSATNGKLRSFLFQNKDSFSEKARGFHVFKRLESPQRSHETYFSV